jgi:hypothetical protein
LLLVPFFEDEEDSLAFFEDFPDADLPREEAVTAAVAAA